MKAVIRKKELIKKVSLSDSTIWRLEKRGKFPARFNYVGRVAWDLDEIEAWLELQKKEGTGKEADRKPDVKLRKTRPIPK
ncbi:helix-turn-helix transcriptional regulator [Serratia aquatilis]|uniref:Helix-turn-helix transcriptional regulator n=1 Tax=Serratia aquatilis TaxID=1737515 RepID=A0ABV6EJH3_9GAMM